MTEQKYLTTPELAEKYSERIKKLEELLSDFEKRNLGNTAPYIQYKEILDYLKQKNKLPNNKSR